MKSEQKTVTREIYALAFGLFLGLCIWKFGNPVILDSKIPIPVTPSDFLHDPWPTRWANWIFLPLALAGTALAFAEKWHWPATKWLWLLPLLWLGWQFFSATKTVDANLTATTLWQFSGCIACYFLGASLSGCERALHWLLAGVLAAFTFCLVRAIDQRLFEFPQIHQTLIEGGHENWTNLSPEMFSEMKRENTIINTNGVDVANPAILAKFAKGRVNGTLVYPNAMAGAVLLLFPISIVLAFSATEKMKPPIRFAVITLTLFLGGAGFFWTGSKLGWLIAIALGSICLFRLKGPMRFKWLAFILILSFGLGIFAVRFQDYFAAGATSTGARLNYWRAAVQTTLMHPLLGTGPGTFQRPYAQLKSSDAEMARLTHNDYIEQFSDSGIAGGILYAAWVSIAMAITSRRVWNSGSTTTFAIFIGLLGWFVQGIGEFGLYIPALAWTAFTLLGCVLGLSGNQIDKAATAN